MKGSDYVKRIISIIFCLSLIFGLSACSYNPPEGYTEKHHTYEEILKFAQSIDPNAIVSKDYTDTLDEYDWEYREWNANINGINCHVASNSDWVWNNGFLAGEFAKIYYRIDTDYDYLLLQKIVSEKQPDWAMEYNDIGSRYNCNDVLSVKIATIEKNALSDNELELIWQDALDIANEYNSYPIRKKPYFSLPAPGKGYDQYLEEYYIETEDTMIIDDLSDQGKTDFFQEYYDAWALLESDLRVE